MGHVRLGRLQHSGNWPEVAHLLESGVLSDEISTAASQAVKEALVQPGTRFDLSNTRRRCRESLSIHYLREPRVNLREREGRAVKYNKSIWVCGR